MNPITHTVLPMMLYTSKHKIILLGIAVRFYRSDPKMANFFIRVCKNNNTSVRGGAIFKTILYTLAFCVLILTIAKYVYSRRCMQQL